MLAVPIFAAGANEAIGSRYLQEWIDGDPLFRLICLLGTIDDSCDIALCRSGNWSAVAGCTSGSFRYCGKRRPPSAWLRLLRARLQQLGDVLVKAFLPPAVSLMIDFILHEDVPWLVEIKLALYRRH